MKHTRELFIQKAIAIHGTKYTYENVAYDRSSIPVAITCPTHGDFYQRPNDHLRGRGCSTCGGSAQVSTVEFVRRSREIHGDRYSYNTTNYTNADSNVTIECLDHGPFSQIASAHLRGTGCPKCSTARAADKIRFTTDAFVARAKLVHGETYDYSQVAYVNAHSRVEIKCSRHGVFFQIANDHLQGNGCPVCKGSISKKERLWLDAVGVPNHSCSRQVTLPLAEKFIVDGYDSDTNTVYEFLGDYWHGNPKKYKSGANPTNGVEYTVLYERTIARLEKLRQYGYNVVYIWESDWSPITHKEKKHVKIE